MPGYGVGAWGGNDDDETPAKPAGFLERLTPKSTPAAAAVSKTAAGGAETPSLATADAAMTAARSELLKEAQKLPEYKTLEAEISRQQRRDSIRGDREIDAYSRDTEAASDQVALSTANTALSKRLEASGVSKGNLGTVMKDLNTAAQEAHKGVGRG